MEKWVDYYKLLKISQKSSNIEIKNAYRQESKLYHPDINDSVNAKERMQQLNEAYEILRSPLKRSKYDIEWNKHNNLVVNGINISEIKNEDNKKFKYDIYSIIHIALTIIILLIFLYSIVNMILNNSFSIFNFFALVSILFLVYFIFFIPIETVLFLLFAVVQIIYRNILYFIKKKK